MSMHGQWINLDLGNAKASYGIGVLPRMDKDSGTILISGVSVIFKDSKHPAEAWALSKYLASDGALPLYQNGLWMPTMKKFYTDPALLAKWAGPNAAHPAGFKDSMMDMVLHHSKPSITYYVKNFGKLDSMISAALDPVWQGQKTAEQAMKDAQREADRIALNRYAPPGVLVNAEWQVLQFRGETSPFLRPPSGKPIPGSFNCNVSGSYAAKSASVIMVGWCWWSLSRLLGFSMPTP